MVRGSVALPVFAVAVIVELAPTLTVATAKAAVPVDPGMWRMPSLLAVAASATMSGTGVADADSSRVLTPEIVGAGSVLVLVNPSLISVGSNEAVGMNANT